MKVLEQKLYDNKSNKKLFLKIISIICHSFLLGVICHSFSL